MGRAILIRATPRTIITANTNTLIRITTERRTSIRTIMMCPIAITSIRMSRKAGSGKMGRVRSVRLPLDLDAWLEDRVLSAQESVSEVFLQLVHGGLRLRPGYMTAHRNALIAFIVRSERGAYVTYCAAIADTFEPGYVRHLYLRVVKAKFAHGTVERFHDLGFYHLRMMHVAVIGGTRTFARNHQRPDRMFRIAFLTEEFALRRLENAFEYFTALGRLRIRNPHARNLELNFSIPLRVLGVNLERGLRDKPETAPFEEWAQLEYLRDRSERGLIAVPWYDAMILILDLGFARTQLAHDHQNRFENIERLEARDHHGFTVDARNELVRTAAADR